MNANPSPPTDGLPSGSEADTRIRLRAPLIGALLALAICLITPFNNAYRQGTPLGGGHFPLAPFYLLVWIMILSALVQAVFRRRLFTGRETLVMWALMVLLSGIAWTGLGRTFFVNLTAPFQFATAENRWPEILWPLLPAGWYPRPPAALDTFTNGIPGGRQMGWGEILARIPWEVWLAPLATWFGFVFLCYLVMVCIVSLLSRQPLYNERMNFPLLRVPLLMQEALDADRLGRFFADRYLLAGLALPVVLHLVNGLSFYNPTIPSIPTLILAGPYFPRTGLFSGFVKLKIAIYPAFIGFAFLASKPISFSFWAFFIAGCLLTGVLSFLGVSIPAAALGTTFGPTLARPEETQMIGAYLVFFGFLAWLARFHFLDILLKAVGLRREEGGSGEWLSTRTAFWGFLGGSAAIVLWGHLHGIPLALSAAVVAAFFLFTLVAMRVICQGGIAYFTLTASPLDGLLAFLGSKIFTPAGLAVAAVVQKVLFLDLRESLMPSLLHTRKITDGVRNPRLVLATVVVALAAGIAASFVAMLAVGYKYGLRELEMDWAVRSTQSLYEGIFALVEAPAPPNPWVLIFTAAGALVMLLLVFGYHRFYWWPIHPLGYLTAYSSAMWTLWFSFFVGWLCNALCMRYGGIALYRRVRLFFVGLIVGDFLMAGSWALYGLFSYASYIVLPD